jgi:ubiquinone biosynthesis protein
MGNKKKTPVSDLIPTRLIAPSERSPVPPARVRTKWFRYFYVFIQLFWLFLGNVCLRVRGRRCIPLREQRTIACLQRLGMLWIRAAQAIVLNSKMISSRFGLRIMDMHDRGGATPFPRIREVIEKELGQPLEEVFDEFDQMPFAATTVSQFHRAKLRKEQIWTAVKVQQPVAEEIFTKDLKFFRRFIGFLRFFSILQSMRWDELCHELNEIKTRELNYYYEASSLDALEENLKDQPVHVPEMYRGYCRQRVLVMEFIQGALLSDYIRMKQEDPERIEGWLKENNIDPKKAARNLFHSLYRQVFEDNFFHGDMNSGNIILLRNNHMAFIECRSAGSLDVESLKKQKMYLRTLAESEYVTAAEIYFLLASRLPRVDLNTVKEKLVRVWRIWETRVYIKDLPYEEKSLAYMTGQVNRVVYDSSFAPLWSFVRLTCTWVHLDNSLAVLSPDFNYIKQIKVYFRTAARREEFASIRHLPSRIAGAMAALHEVPKRTGEYSLFKEALIRRQAQVVTGSASKLDAVIAAGFGFISFLILLIGGFLVSVFGIHYLEIDLQSILGPQLSWLALHVPDMGIVAWLVVLAMFIFLWGFFRIQGRRFSRQEFGQDGGAGGLET